jgi:transcriptional regulator with XRE-family HTH domain
MGKKVEITQIGPNTVLHPSLSPAFYILNSDFSPFTAISRHLMAPRLPLTILPVKYRRREMGSKFFGRAIKRWRLVAGLSQDELAERAQVSVTLVGTIERERGHLSEEIFCKLCLGLETELGRPMLRSVLHDVLSNLWQELSAIEKPLRQERGWEAEEGERLDTSPGDFERSLDSALTEVKKLALLWYRSQGPRMHGPEWMPALQSDLLPEGIERAAAAGKARVRKSGKRPKQPAGK